MWRHSPVAPAAPRTLLFSFKSVELFLHRNETLCIWIAEATHMHHCVKISTRARGMNYSFWARGPYVVSGVRATGLQALCHQFLLSPPFSIDLHHPFCSTYDLTPRATASSVLFQKHQWAARYSNSFARLLIRSYNWSYPPWNNFHYHFMISWQNCCFVSGNSNFRISARRSQILIYFALPLQIPESVHCTDL